MDSPSKGRLLEREDFSASYSGPDRVVHVSELRKIAESRPPLIPVKTGLPSLDIYCGGGFRRGELIVVSGPTKHGKSTFCLTISRNMAALGCKTLWFSFEMPQEILFCEKYPNMETHIPLELKACDVEWIKTKTLEAKVKYDCRAVFIDHLHFVVDMAKTKNPSLEIGAIVRQLKRMAIDMNITVFLIAHIGKENKLEPEKLSDGDIRDSSFVPQEADATIMVSRWFRDEEAKKVKRSNTQTRITVCNHRKTGHFDKELVAKQVDGYLEEVEIIDYTKKARDDHEDFF